MQQPPKRIGAHVTTNGGLQTGLQKAIEIGANCIQIFSSAPHQWKSSNHSPQEKQTFKESCTEDDIQPVFIHAPYLINLASDNEELLEKSTTAMVNDLFFAHDIGALGVIVHFGSHSDGWKGGKRNACITIVHDILKKTPPDTSFIIENSAGSGSKIAGDLEVLKTMYDDIDSPRVKFCIDTAHTFATGYDVATKEATKQFIEDTARTIGWNTVICVHANDSKGTLGSKLDRHENIGKGTIGIECFETLLNDSNLQHIPFILEVPGEEREGPNKENIDILKHLIRKP